MRRKKKSFRTGRTRILSIVLCLILVLGVLLPESGVLASGIQSAAVESTYESGGETSDSTTPETTVQESETSQSLSSESPADTSETIVQTEPSTSADETQSTDNETTVPDTGESTGESQSGETEVAETAESETEQTQESELSYEQAARAALALYGTGAAFRDGEVISDAQNYFEFSGVPTGNQPPSFTVQVGEITADSVPKIEGYDFINATISDNDGGQIVVNSVGTLTYGESTYIYYTTEGSSSSLAAMVLGSDQKITLNYELHRETYEIIYSVTGDSSSVTVDSIFGTDRPTTVTSGNSYAFRVTIPRGYTATVSVNGDEQGQLGVEPTYTVDDPTAGVGSVITGSGELTLSGTYEITNVSKNQTVTVKLTQRQNYDFSSYLWTQTRYAYDRADFGTTSGTFSGVSSTQQSRELWSFTTNEFERNSNDTEWILDSLQINGTKLNIPYVSRNNRTDSETTVLPSGTVVTISAEYNSFRWSNRHSRTYTISVSNCYENITITGGNLNSSGWTEVIPDRLTGVEFQIFDRQSGDTQDQWKTLEQSEPFGVGNYGDNNKNYWFGTDGSLRFRLVSGYVNPQVTYGTTSGIDDNDLRSLVSVSRTPDSDGWYYITINGQNSNSITMLRIEAEIGYYDVSYSAGDTSVNVGDTLPSYDNGDYNIVNNDQIIVSSTIPVDSTNQYVFDYWTLEGYVDESGEAITIYPNQLLDLENVAGYAVQDEDGNYVLPLEAHWISSESAEQITYTVQFILVDENGGETVVETIAYQAPKGSTIILNTDAQEVKDFLEKHPEYVLDEERTERYFPNVQAGNVLPVYFTKAVTNVTITKDVTGGLGDVTKSFNFDLEIDGESQEGFSLTDGASEVLKNIKIGSTITFAETNAEGYIVTVTYTDSDSEDAKTVASNDGSYTVTVTKGMTITVENNKEAIPDTGVILDSLPYILIIAVIVVIAAVLIIRRHKLNQVD